MGKIINKIIQFAVVTPHADDTAKLIRETLSLGPQKVWDFKFPAIFDTTIDGENKSWQMKLAFGWIGQMQYEIIEPTGGQSLYQAYLEKWKKPGIQHLLLDRGKVSYKEMKQTLKDAGMPVYNEAKTNVAVKIGFLTLPPLPMFLAKSLSTVFGYTNTLDTLKTVIETSKYPPGVEPRQGIRMGVPSYWTEGNQNNFEVLPENCLIREVEGFIVLVRDLKAAKVQYEKLFGNPASVTNNELFFYLETNLVKVVQPLPSSGYDKILQQNGEGVQILRVVPGETNRQKLQEKFVQKGFVVLERTPQYTLYFHGKLPFQIEIAS